MQNKKAQIGYGLTWLYKMVLIVVIAGGIVFVILNHYSRNIDVRNMEASVISQKIATCIAPNGILKEFSNASIQKCISIDEQEIYINTSLKNDNLEFGDDFLLKLCQAMEQKVKVENYPACLHSSYMILEGGKAEKLTIFIAINKIDTNL